MSTTLIDHAVRAQQRGFHIFPLPPGEKFDRRLRWSQIATNDLNQIIAWWTANPMANIGVACKQSQLLVVDCDMPKKDYQLLHDEKTAHWKFLYEKLRSPIADGHDCLRELASQHGANIADLERTYLVCTGSMGLHLYFKWPPGIRASQASLVRTLLDVRSNGGSNGGYVLAAGSQTDKGPYVVEHDGPVLPAPAWLVELVREKEKPPRPQLLTDQVERFLAGKGGGSYSGLVDSVSSAAEGNRNNCLMWAASAMADDGASIEECWAHLAGPATANGLTEMEVRQTISSAYRRKG